MIGNGKIKIRIGDEESEIDTESVASITNIDIGMSQVSAQIAFYGELLALAEAEKIKIDAAYRRWRAEQTKIILAKDEKLAEWKVRAEIESNQTFVSYKEAEAQAEYNSTSLKILVRALEEKSPNLRSKGARARAELDATDMGTKTRNDLNERYQALREKQEQHPARKPAKKGD